MTAIAGILIIDERCLVREGLKCVLTERGFKVEGHEPCFTATLQRLRAGDDGIDLLLGDPGSRLEEELEAVEAIQREFPSIKIVLLTDCMTPAWLGRAAKSGAAGFLTQDISPEALKHSLNLVLTGEQIVPTATPRDVHVPPPSVGANVNDSAGDILAALAAREVPTASSSGATRLRTPHLVPSSPRSEGEDLPLQGLALLSTREKQILDCLARGLSNKLIARQLDMAEATVKVHVRTLLRKLKAKNRTQAAIWSLRSDAAGHGSARTDGPTRSDASPVLKPRLRHVRESIRERSPSAIPIRGAVGACKLPDSTVANDK
jgi:two-component system, NarL family, nitrate/nitrite response regulator NarL